MTAQPIVRVTDHATRDEIAEALEARTRRLMAERAGMPCTWQTRQRRGELLQEIQDSLDEWLDVR